MPHPNLPALFLILLSMENSEAYEPVAKVPGSLYACMEKSTCDIAPLRPKWTGWMECWWEIHLIWQPLKFPVVYFNSTCNLLWLIVSKDWYNEILLYIVFACFSEPAFLYKKLRALISWFYKQRIHERKGSENRKDVRKKSLISDSKR